MAPDIEALYPQIGRRLIDLAGEPFVQGYIRVELADDFGSVGLFVDRGDGAYTYLIDEEGQLYDLFSQLRASYIAAGFGAWSQATFALHANGTFSIEFGHDDISDLGQGGFRRDAWVRRVLGEQANVHWLNS